MKKQILFLILSLLCISNASASTRQIWASIAPSTGDVNLTNTSNTLANQIVIEIPSAVLQGAGTTYIDKVTIYCSNVYPNYGVPNGNINIRLLWRDDSNIFLSGDWQLIDSNYYNLPASTCNDYGVPLTFTTDNQVSTMGSYFGMNHSVAIGIGISTTSTNGVGVVYANKSYGNASDYYFRTPNDTTYSPIIKFVNRSSIDVMENNDIVDYMPVSIYGGVATPTPTPTPTPAPDCSYPGSDSYPCPNITGLPPNGSTGDFLGNTSIPVSYKPGDNGKLGNNTAPGSFGTFAISMGYAATVDGYIQMCQDYMMFYTGLGMLIYVLMLWTKERR